MDPITATAAFATIVQLLAIFKQERGNKAGEDHREFIEWLNYHKHEEIKTLICNTAAIQAEVDKLLRQDNTVILKKLDEIGNLLVTLLSRVDAFSGLASAMVPGASLSEQAISVLQQLVNSGSRWFHRVLWRGGVPSFHLERGGQIKYDNLQFIEADLEQLVGRGLLSVKHNNSGEPVYWVTREAVEVLSIMDRPRREMAVEPMKWHGAQ